nr:MAG TPA: hypothetical protein [Caudoviricetes sp.]
MLEKIFFHESMNFHMELEKQKLQAMLGGK